MGTFTHLDGVLAGGSRIDREIQNSQEYFLGLSYRLRGALVPVVALCSDAVMQSAVCSAVAALLVVDELSMRGGIELDTRIGSDRRKTPVDELNVRGGACRLCLGGSS